MILVPAGKGCVGEYDEREPGSTGAAVIVSLVAKLPAKQQTVATVHVFTLMILSPKKTKVIS
jgi:hypothetical protein